MNNIEKIKCLRELEEQKEQLERQLNLLSKNIQEQRNSCLHMGVNLGYHGQYPGTMNKYRCLLCGAGRDDDFFYVSNSVNAEKYLPQYDIRDKSQCDIKFDHIQTLTLGLLKENPDMSREELIDKLNNLIQKSVSFRENQNSPRLVKALNHKK